MSKKGDIHIYLGEMALKLRKIANAGGSTVSREIREAVRKHIKEREWIANLQLELKELKSRKL
jgi:hypothetical protein